MCRYIARISEIKQQEPSHNYDDCKIGSGHWAGVDLEVWLRLLKPSP